MITAPATAKTSAFKFIALRAVIVIFVEKAGRTNAADMRGLMSHSPDLDVKFINRGPIQLSLSIQGSMIESLSICKTWFLHCSDCSRRDSA
jgi:hypothetical protein